MHIDTGSPEAQAARPLAATVTKAEYDARIMNYLPFIRSRCRKLVGLHRVDFDDLVQEILLYLLERHDNWQPQDAANKWHGFQSYVYWAIRSVLKRQLYHKHRVDHWTVSEAVARDNGADDGDGPSLFDLVAIDPTAPDELDAKTVRMHARKHPDGALLLRFYVNGETLVDIGLDNGTSKQRIRQRLDKALEWLRGELLIEGYEPIDIPVPNSRIGNGRRMTSEERAAANERDRKCRRQRHASRNNSRATDQPDRGDDTASQPSPAVHRVWLHSTSMRMQGFDVILASLGRPTQKLVDARG